MKPVPEFRFPVNAQAFTDLNKKLSSLTPEQTNDVDDSVWEHLAEYDWFVRLNEYLESGEILIYEGKNGYGFVFGDWSEEEKQIEVDDMAGEGGHSVTFAELATALHECIYPQDDEGDSAY